MHYRVISLQCTNTYAAVCCHIRNTLIYSETLFEVKST